MLSSRDYGNLRNKTERNISLILRLTVISDTKLFCGLFLQLTYLMVISLIPSIRDFVCIAFAQKTFLNCRCMISGSSLDFRKVLRMMFSATRSSSTFGLLETRVSRFGCARFLTSYYLDSMCYV